MKGDTSVGRMAKDTDQRAFHRTSISADIQRIRAALVRVETSLVMIGNLPGGARAPSKKNQSVVKAK